MIRQRLLHFHFQFLLFLDLVYYPNFKTLQSPRCQSETKNLKSCVHLIRREMTESEVYNLGPPVEV